MHRCPECGAEYAGDDTSCAIRFEHLLALDHSRREPWGSRHGQAFAAFALQHPRTHAASLDAAWDSLYRIYHIGEPPERVFIARRRGEALSHARPASQPVVPFGVTIADLGDFAADEYPEALDRWCRAALAGWSA